MEAGRLGLHLNLNLGDAALAMGLVQGRPWVERLRDAAALSAAAVAAPVAGEVDLVRYRRLRRAVSVEPY